MSLILDIGQGSGLAAAGGVRPFLPPFVAGALGRGDVGVNFSGGDFAFLESVPFLVALAALAVIAHAAELPAPAFAAAAIALGALLFAGSLTEGDRDGWVGLPAGAACAALGWYGAGPLFARARARLADGGALIGAYREVAALALVVVAVAVPPLSFAALAVLLLLVLRGRRAEERKYEGLRILR